MNLDTPSAVETILAQHVWNIITLIHEATGETKIAFEYSMAMIAVVMTSASVIWLSIFIIMQAYEHIPTQTKTTTIWVSMGLSLFWWLEYSNCNRNSWTFMKVHLWVAS